jgi:hypothetical protein
LSIIQWYFNSFILHYKSSKDEFNFVHDIAQCTVHSLYIIYIRILIIVEENEITRVNPFTQIKGLIIKHFGKEFSLDFILYTTWWEGKDGKFPRKNYDYAFSAFV